MVLSLRPPPPVRRRKGQAALRVRRARSRIVRRAPRDPRARVSPTLLVRQAALAGVALLAALGALALGGEDGRTVTPSPDQVETVAPWQEAAVGVRGRPGRRTTCGAVLGSNTVGVIHPVLPCGARLVLQIG